jgi:hypothetical protein
MVLKVSIETVYCTHVCGPVSRRFSNQRRKAGAWYLPSIIHAMYRLNGMASNVVPRRIDMGRNHMVFSS